MASFKEIVRNSSVCLEMQEVDGKGVIERLIDVAIAEQRLVPECREAVIRAVMNREASASTALSEGVALPHARTDCVQDIVCMLGTHKTGIDFDAPDGGPTHVFVLLLVPAKVACNHIHFLANLSRCLMESAVRTALLRATTSEEFVEIILNSSARGAF